jgi:hypothetical protein
MRLLILTTSLIGLDIFNAASHGFEVLSRCKFLPFQDIVSK